MRVRILRHADYQRTRWKNDGGWTTELARFPDANGLNAVFDWRISIAEIESDGDFSSFPGYDRSIAILDGAGMELRFDQADPMRLCERLKFFHFAGEWKTHCRLFTGPTRDFNVMVRRNIVRAEVLHRPIVGPMVFFDDLAVSWFIYLVAGTLQLESGNEQLLLESGESLRLEPDASKAHIVLNGSGELLMIKLFEIRECAGN